MKKRKPPKHIPLFDLNLTRETKSRVIQVLDSRWLTSGKAAQELEVKIGAYLKVKHVAAVNSATAGLYLALRALNVRQGDTVITTPFTFIATIETILLTGATPQLVDIDPVTLCIDPMQVAHAIDKHTRAILPVDIAGHPADYVSLRKLSNEAKLPLLADSAHAITAKLKNRSTAHYADVAVYSLYSTKNLTAGEGGLVVSRKKEIIESVRRLSRHGIDRGTYERRQKSRTWDYDVVDFGFKANLSDLHAAVALGQLTRLDQDQMQREKIAQRYDKNLSVLNDLLHVPLSRSEVSHGWHLYIIKLRLDHLRFSRDDVIEKMAECGIECGVHYKPVFDMSYYRKHLGLSPKNYPVAALAGQSVVSLPIFPALKIADVDFVCDRLIDVLKKNRR